MITNSIKFICFVVFEFEKTNKRISQNTNRIGFLNDDVLGFGRAVELSFFVPHLFVFDFVRRLYFSLVVFYVPKQKDFSSN